MDFTEERCLIALADRGTITAAAAELGLARATVRRRIQALEKRLGVALTSGGELRVELTESGALYVERSRFLVRQAEDLQALVRTKGRVPTGRVRIASPIGSAGPEIAIALKHLASRYPDLRYELWFTANPVEALASGADLAVLFGHYPLGDWKVTALGVAHVRAFAHPEYLHGAGRPLTLDDLADHRLLHATSLPLAASTWPTLDGGTIPIDPWLTTTDLDAVRQAVTAGLGVGLVLADVADPSLEPVLPTVLGSPIKLWALTTPAGAKLARVRAVIDGARRYLADEEWTMPTSTQLDDSTWAQVVVDLLNR